MRTITRRVTILLATFCVTTLLSSGTAHAGGDKHGKLCEQLTCTAAQQTQIKAIHDASAPTIKAARDAIDALEQQQRAEWQKASPSASTLERLDTQIDVQRDKIGDQRRADGLKIHALLTAEQRTKFAERQSHHGKRHGKGKPDKSV